MTAAATKKTKSIDKDSNIKNNDVTKKSKIAITKDTDNKLEKKNDKNIDKIKKLTIVDKNLTTKAVDALLKYHNNNIDDKKSLLGTDVSIRIQFTLERPPSTNQIKPIPIDIPHSLNKIFKGIDEDAMNTDNDDDDNIDDPEICLIVKDESKIIIQDMINEFPEHLKCIKKIITLTSLRTKYKEYKNKRELLKLYTLFIADDRILPMLTNILGSTFIKNKKQPIPIDITKKSKLVNNINKILSSTFMTYTAGGNCISILAGTTSMSTNHIVNNILSITNNAVIRMPRKWSNIRNIGIKLPKSTELPIYNKTPEQLIEISLMAGMKPYYIEMKDEENEKDNNDKEKTDEIDRKRKLQIAKGKSPLLKAIKKQKEIDNNKKDDNNDEENQPSIKKARKGSDADIVTNKTNNKDENQPSTKKARKGSDADITAIKSNKEKEVVKEITPTKNTKEAKEPKTTEKVLSKKERKRSIDKTKEEDIKVDNNHNNNNEQSKKHKVEKVTPSKKESTPSSSSSSSVTKTPKSNSKKDIVKDNDEIKKSAKKEKNNKVETKITTPLKSDKKSNEKDTNSINKKKDSKETIKSPDTKKNSDANQTFIPAVKYSGSKNGYVFKKDKQGVGYYIDNKPIVDKAVLDAFVRMGGRNNGGGGGGGGGNRRKSGGGGGFNKGKNNNNNRRKSR